MSAIWGIISKKANNNIPDSLNNLFAKMKASMSVFPFDRIDTISQETGLFACGHQILTIEDEKDISPIWDEDEHILFCSNCFLYNRNDLINQLNDRSLETCGDSQIAHKAFKTWGYSFAEKLRGCFAFAIYDEKNNQLHLFSDHFTMQYFAYSNTPEYICFSNTYRPILACLGDNVKICREFIVNAYRGISPMDFYKEAITPYENVYHLDYATHITINLNTGEETRERYWNPLKNIKKLKLKSDDEYKAAFRKLFENLTRSMLRSKDETGIMLSGGLDSSSVAAFAAPILKERGKKLFSYTSVPSTDYVDDKKNPILINDETPLIELQKDFHQNLFPHYINGDKDCCFTDIDYYQNFYGIPVKPAANNINIVDMSIAAMQDNCSILLTGANGNATISYGYLHNYVSLNLTKLHFIKAYKEISRSGKRHKVSRKHLIKKSIWSTYDYLFKKPKEKHLFLKPEDEKKYGLTHPALDDKKQHGTSNFSNVRHKKNFMVFPTQYSQKGFFNTYIGLKYHYLQLDPTLTVEMIEFCLSLPAECFVYDGIDRRLVRVYLKDLLPEAITDMQKGFGVQSPDVDYRANRDIDKYIDQLFTNLDEPLLREYLDPDKIGKINQELKEAAKNHCLSKKQCLALSVLASLGGFLRDHTK